MEKGDKGSTMILFLHVRYLPFSLLFSPFFPIFPLSSSFYRPFLFLPYFPTFSSYLFRLLPCRLIQFLVVSFTLPSFFFPPTFLYLFPSVCFLCSSLFFLGAGVSVACCWYCSRSMHLKCSSLRCFLNYLNKVKQEAQLSPSDRAMRLVSSNLANYHATVQKQLIRQVLTKPMVWSRKYSWRQCVINKPTTVELCISPVYRRLAMANFFKFTV